MKLINALLPSVVLQVALAGNVTITTSIVVTDYTTFCPEPTSFVVNNRTITVTEATTVTITGPCTVKTTLTSCESSESFTALPSFGLSESSGFKNFTSIESSSIPTNSVSTISVPNTSSKSNTILNSASSYKTSSLIPSTSAIYHSVSNISSSGGASKPVIGAAMVVIAAGVLI